MDKGIDRTEGSRHKSKGVREKRSAPPPSGGAGQPSGAPFDQADDPLPTRQWELA